MSFSVVLESLHVLKVALSLAVLGFLPGYLLLTWAPGRALGQRGFRTFERHVAAVVLSLALSSILALLLAQAGFFDVDLMVLILAGVGVIAWLRSPPREPVRELNTTDGRQSVLLLLAVVVFAALAFTPPFQTTLWAGDSTLYVGYGVQISRSGSYLFEDPLLAEIPVDRREELFRNQTEDDRTGSQARFPGGIGFVDIAEGHVAAGFSPLFPVWIAIIAQLFGATNVFWASSWFGVCAVAMVFCLGRALHSEQAGLFASVWLLACMPQIWFSRLPMSEVASQFFVLAGIWVALLYLRTESRVLAAAAGLVLGTAGLSGLDVMVTTTAGLLAYAATLLASGRRIAHARAFVTTYAVMVVYGLAHLVHYPSNYTSFIAERLPRLPFGASLVSVLEVASAEVWLVAGAAVVALSATVLGLLAKRRVDSSQTRGRLLSLALGAVVGLYLAGYLLASIPRYPDTLRWLPAYLSWPVVALFLVSLAGILTRRVVRARDPHAMALLAGLAVASIPVLYNPQLQDFGIHIGTMRRFVPLVIPAIFLVAAIGAAWFARQLRPPIRRAVVPVTVGILLLLVARPSATLVGQRFWDDGVVASNELASMFPSNAVILVSPELAGVQAQVMLTFWHGYGGLALNQGYDTPGILEDQMVDWLRRGREVFLLTTTADRHFRGAALTLAEHGTDELALRTLVDAPGPPRDIEIRRLRITAYRFGLAPTPSSFIDVGTYASDALFPLSGFYAPETDASAGSYRWTGPSAAIEIPAASRVTLVLRGTRPPGAPAAVVSISANGRPILLNLTIPSVPTEVVLDGLDVGSTDTLTIGIESSTFNPRRLGLSGDGRDLGVQVYRAELERQ